MARAAPGVPRVASSVGVGDDESVKLLGTIVTWVGLVWVCVVAIVAVVSGCLPASGSDGVSWLTFPASGSDVVRAVVLTALATPGVAMIALGSKAVSGAELRRTVAANAERRANCEHDYQPIGTAGEEYCERCGSWLRPEL